MSHEITIRDNGQAEMAFTGSRSAIWHGLGQELQVGASLEEWRKAAGMDWEVQEAEVLYGAKAGIFEFPEKKVLFRGDTDEPLSVVSSKFQIVQPEEVLEFFRDLVEHHGMQLSTAGTLFGGKRFWALADTGLDSEVVEGDAVKGRLLLATSVDGTLATTAKFVSERVVCNNTLTVALGENTKQLMKVSHKSVFNAKDVHINMGLVDKAWSDFMDKLRSLADKPMSLEQMEQFYKERLFNPEKSEEEQTWGVKRELARIMEAAQNGAGAGLGYGTRWAALNAATNYYTHGDGKRNASRQFEDSYYGKLDAKKVDTLDALIS